MKGPLIHTRQGRWMRFVDVVVTLLAWAGFLLLFGRGIYGILQHQGLTVASRLQTFLATADTLMGYLVIAGVNAGVLATWALYNQIRRRVERRGKIPALDDAKLAVSFQLTPQLLHSLRSQRVIVVHHNEHGGIAGVEARAAPEMGSHPDPANDAVGQSSSHGGSLRA